MSVATPTPIAPKVRGFICTTAHPVGCEKNVERQIASVQSKGKLNGGPKKVLVIGASTGFGLASRINAAFGSGADTIGVSFERPAAGKRTASAGWYNTAAFEKKATATGLYAKSINGDAFSNEIKQQVIDLIQNDWGGQCDLIIYSIASPRRTHPESGITYQSTLKPIGQSFADKTVDVMRKKVGPVSLDPATNEDIENTIHVMGGEDWALWIHALLDANCLAQGVKTVAYTYIGPSLTHAIYRDGTIGRAKAHLQQTGDELNTILAEKIGGEAIISVNKALVTQASAAIPVVPLYISILFKEMKERGTHEGCIEQIQRLFYNKLYGTEQERDEAGRIRIDDWEMDDEVQQKVLEKWHNITTENLLTDTDLDGYIKDFYQLFGFEIDEIDYSEPVNVNVPIPSIEETP